MGADEYMDSEGDNPVEELQELGGARVILGTAPSSQAMTDVIDGLGRDGTLLVVAASGEPIEVSPMQLIDARRSIAGWPSGDASDSEDTLEFCAQSDIEPMIETYDLDEVDEAYDRMMNSEVRFRSVLTMD
jgi:alcohol dehydrogenase/propanol-preferring alcohol dehydrogenase